MREPTIEQLRAINRLSAISDFSDMFLPWLRESAHEELQRAVAVRGPERDEALGGYARISEAIETVDHAKDILTAKMADQSDAARDAEQDT